MRWVPERIVKARYLPMMMWGPGDQTILPELATMARKGQYVWLDGGRHLVSPTHITNLVHGIELALDRGDPGEIYFITDGDHVSMKDFLSRYAATRRRHSPGPLHSGVGGPCGRCGAGRGLESTPPSWQATRSPVWRQLSSPGR